MAYTFLDFETTGLSHLEDQVIEIGAIKTDEQFNEIGRLHTMVKLVEGRVLKPFITELTGIKTEDTYTGVSEAVGLNMVKDFIGTSIVVCQYASFDLSFLSKAIEPEYFMCTRTMSQLLNPKERAGLKDICERYGIHLDHHRSISDVEATIEAFKIMFPICLEKKLPTLNVLMQSEERPLKFIPLEAVVIGKEAYLKNLEEAEGEE
jgi:DNA polymerase III subunit epsilon